MPEEERKIPSPTVRGNVKCMDCTNPACDRLGYCLAGEITALKARLAKLEGTIQ